MKIELLHLWKSWLQFKKSVDDNKMKLKSTPTEWALHRIVRTFSSNEDLTMIYEIAKVALVTPVTNAWPERGASAVKRVKTCFRSQMKDDLLDSLLMITINGPAFKTAEYENLMEEVTNIYQSKSHKKHPGNFSTTVKVKKVSISTQTITIDDNVDDQIETIDKKLQETIKNTEPWFRNEVENDSDDDNDKDDDSTDSDSEADDSF